MPAIDYIVGSLPTAALVLIHFLRTEHRLTKIETLIEVLMTKNGCNPKNNPRAPKTTPLVRLK